jgi:hypothetical protein
MRTSIISLLNVLAASSLAAAQTATPAPTPPALLDSTPIVLTAGTRVPVVAVRRIATRSIHTGDTVYLQTTTPVSLDGRVAIPAGTSILATVSSAARRGWLHPELALELRASTFTFANGYTAAGPSLTSESAVGESGVRRDDSNAIPLVVGSAVVGGIVAGPVVPVIGAGLYLALLMHPNQVAMDAGAPVELVLDRPLTLDALRVADAARAAANIHTIYASNGRDCFDPGTPATPDVTIPGNPGTPAMGDIPGTPPTPPVTIPGTPGTPPSSSRCR